MEALQFDPKKKTLTLIRTDIPAVVEKNDVVKVVYAGICGTDLHVVDVSCLMFNCFKWVHILFDSKNKSSHH